MTQLLVRYNSNAIADSCALCGQPTTIPAGTQLVEAYTQRPVCQGCGKRHDPAMAALVHLADEAERVGRIGRHTVVPPYTALLELAQAADNYAAKTTVDPGLPAR
jgi:hypothetical protein